MNNNNSDQSRMVVEWGYTQITNLIPGISNEIIARIMKVAECQAAMVRRGSIGPVELKESVYETVKVWEPGVKNDVAETMSEIVGRVYGMDLRGIKLHGLPFQKTNSMDPSMNKTIKNQTIDYINTCITRDGKLPEPEYVETALLTTITIAFQIANAVRDGDERWKYPKTLPPECIGMCLIASGIVARMRMANGDYKAVFYHTDGVFRGTWRPVTDVNKEYWGNRLIRRYNAKITKAAREEIYKYLEECAPERVETADPMITAVGNGVYFHETGQLLGYEECRGLTLCRKIQTNLNLNAQNVIIHNTDDGTDWDVESWVKEFFDSPEMVEALWSVVQAVCRPGVDWDKTIWFTNTNGRGANGKSTFCKLLANLIGKEAVRVIDVAHFDTEFALQGIMNAMLIMSTENGVNKFVDEVKNYKILVTKDMVNINVKFGAPYACVYQGMILECFNDLPRIRDKSGSFYRRLYIMDWTKCFTGKERKYITSDYINRQAVLEYVLKKVLVDMPPLKRLPEPPEVREMCDTYIKSNDPIERFMDEMALPNEDGVIELSWDFVPFHFLYDLYRAWYQKTENSSFSLGLNKFTQEIRNWAEKHSDFWEATVDKNGKIRQQRPGKRMDAAEPLILEYDLKDWMNPAYTGGRNKDILCHPALKAKYSGIFRKTPTP